MEETLPRLDDLKNPLFSDLLAPFEGLHWQSKQYRL